MRRIEDYTMTESIQRVLLAGDSISFGYGPKVGRILEGVFDVENLPQNGGPSANLLAHVDEWMTNPNFDIIHFNCGIHDLLVYSVPLRVYEANLERIVNRLRQHTSSVLVWAMTTPVMGNEDGRSYNEVARKVMTRYEVHVNDLHRVIENGDEEQCISQDGVHMTDYGYELLARAVADYLLALKT